MPNLKLLSTILVGAASGALSAALVTVVISPGPAGSSVPSYRVIERTATVGSNSSVTEDSKCPSGMVPVGGGWRDPYGGAGGGDIDPSRRGWDIYLTNISAHSYSFKFDVLCITP